MDSEREGRGHGLFRDYGEASRRLRYVAFARERLQHHQLHAVQARSDARTARRLPKHGLKFGFYYSQAFDWGEANGAGNAWDYANPGGDKLIGGRNWWETRPEFLPKARKYVDEKAIPQLQELVRLYDPDIFWFDTASKLPPSENLRIMKAVRAASAHVIINGRLVRNLGDYASTADRPAELAPHEGDWEGIPTTNESYGWNKFDQSHKPVGHFIQLLAK